MPVDLRGIYGTGSSSALTLISTLVINDGSSVAGMPLNVSKSPVLIGWGFQNVIADTHKQLQVLSADMYDARNGETDSLATTTTSLINNKHYWTRVPFRGGVRSNSIYSNTAAGKPLAWNMDDYPGAYPVVRCALTSPNQVKVSQVLGAATAQTTFSSTAFAPTVPLKAAKYALLGATAQNLTDNAVLRFRHSDFNGFAPGFPVTDMVAVADARANTSSDYILYGVPGYQFVLMDAFLGTGCPVFTAGSGASGLSIEIADTTADTASVTLYLAAVG